MTYATVEQAISFIRSFGPGCYMAKTDIKSAFRILPVHPDDYHLLGFHWDNGYYYDRCLPMGCSSSCAIFEEFSTSLEWIAYQFLHDVAILHILDDFLFISPSYQSCLGALLVFQAICKDIGVPLAPDKTEGPDQVLSFAGIQLDTQSMSASLPQDKIYKFIGFIDLYSPLKSITLRQLQSITGMLNFACQIILPARAFSRRLHDLTMGVSKHYHHIRLTSQAKLDLQVWRNFLSNYNYKTFFLDMRFQSPHVLKFFTDSAASIGYAGLFGSHWFTGTWHDQCKSLNSS